MEWSRVAAEWRRFTSIIKQRWQRLSHEEIETCAGQRDPLERKIQEHYGLSRDEAQREVDNWLNLPEA